MRNEKTFWHFDVNSPNPTQIRIRKRFGGFIVFAQPKKKRNEIKKLISQWMQTFQTLTTQIQIQTKQKMIILRSVGFDFHLDDKRFGWREFVSFIQPTTHRKEIAVLIFRMRFHLYYHWVNLGIDQGLRYSKHFIGPKYFIFISHTNSVFFLLSSSSCSLKFNSCFCFFFLPFVFPFVFWIRIFGRWLLFLSLWFA